MHALDSTVPPSSEKRPHENTSLRAISLAARKGSITEDKHAIGKLGSNRKPIEIRSRPSKSEILERCRYLMHVSLRRSSRRICPRLIVSALYYGEKKIS